jgi:hypothetical protein
VTTSTEGHPPPHGRFVAIAVRWHDGWELHIEGEGMATGGGVTHVTSLDTAEAEVRSFLRDTYGVDFSDTVIEVISTEH